MIIGIFGGGGFLGSSICDRLLNDGHQIKVFERPRISPYRFFNGDETVDWVTGDFSSAHDIKAFIEGVDVVIHLVSSTLPRGSNDDVIFDVQTNVISTLQLLNAMVREGVKRIIFISSGGTVYGNPIYIPLDENHPTNPTVSYGITKLAIEKYLHLFQGLYGIKATILRVANPYGERQRIETAQGAIGVFMGKVLCGEPIEIWGDGGVIRDYVYVEDVADAFSKAIDYSGPYSVFNIGSGIGKSLNEVISALESVLGIHIAVNHKPARVFDVAVSVLNNSLALKELGWTPKTNFYDGIKKTAAWMSSNLTK
ncbi:NAD-dependent epimerase/dehydratase family protein [Polynucleobacter sp. UB-Raua-W9]|uniref:NAD-dependent epimerase/dehydratase family protein n=1 Tax=Polynucleobacter sp. UB-Raua-W9 TaxID=1819736 RepID=UPI001BFE3114|nr:NAD-dependent epimerase/dehydratase family protein [Polynucleobacter sp. UB-Raua-W9]QWD72747.1 NAD-dependent epimerase/dehydratase family protein [Polynucleobacter sp. UB-Raua-W9]